MRRSVRKPPRIEERARYCLVRSNRRTCALEITADGRLVVRAPFSLDEARIESLIRKHEQWIDAKRKMLGQRIGPGPATGFREGDKVPFLGKDYTIRYVEDEGEPGVCLDGRFLFFRGERRSATALFREWCRLQAREVLPERVNRFGPSFDTGAGTIRITDARKRWGSCGVRGTLNFSWRLIMAPLDVIDYVVVHELAHLREPNHSRRFWQHVRSLLPDFKERREWLREHEHSLLAL